MISLETNNNRNRLVGIGGQHTNITMFMEVIANGTLLTISPLRLILVTAKHSKAQMNTLGYLYVLCFNLLSMVHGSSTVRDCNNSCL